MSDALATVQAARYVLDMEAIKLTTRNGQLTKKAVVALCEALDDGANEQAYSETNGRCYGEDAWGFLVRGGRIVMIDGTHKYPAIHTWKAY